MIIKNNDWFILNSKNRAARRRQQLSSALPPFYKGIFESDEDKLGYVDYQLPFDIYWLSQKQPKKVEPLIKPAKQPKKKSVNPPKQKQASSPNKKLINKIPADLPIEQKVLPPVKNEKKERTIIHINKDLIKIEDLTEDEKRIVSQTCIFLKRNLRRLKEKQELKDKTNIAQKQHVEEQQVILFLSQNYYHPDVAKETNNPTEISNISHKGYYLCIEK